MSSLSLFPHLKTPLFFLYAIVVPTSTGGAAILLPPPGQMKSKQGVVVDLLDNFKTYLCLSIPCLPSTIKKNTCLSYITASLYAMQSGLS